MAMRGEVLRGRVKCGEERLSIARKGELWRGEVW